VVPDETLTRAGVHLGTTYPRPVVAHDVARQRALAAFAEFKADDKPATAQEKARADEN
jgi:deoxyribodipyrimidine photo-lyase